MKNTNKIAEQLFDKIRSRFEKINIRDKDSKRTDVEQDARLFSFDYISSSNKNYGNITLNLLDENQLVVSYSKNISEHLTGKDQQEWFEFLKSLRFFAKRNLLQFAVRDNGRDILNVRDLEQAAKSSAMVTSESRLSGNSRTSYQNIGPVRLVVKHSDVINDEIRGARSRKIESIFVETAEGERFRMPFKKLSAGRAMAEHIGNGGRVHDAIGQHVIEMVEEMTKLASFVRGTRNRVFEDSETQNMCEAAADRYHYLNSSLKTMGKSRGYKEYVENYTPAVQESDEVDIGALKERFIKKVFDDRMEQALPYVHRAYQNRHQMKQNKYIKEFDDWADGMSNDEAVISDDAIAELKQLMKLPLTVGVDAADAIGIINNIIEDEGLFRELLSISQEQGPDTDARPAIGQWISQHQSEEQAKTPIYPIEQDSAPGGAEPPPDEAEPNEQPAAQDQENPPPVEDEENQQEPEEENSGLGKPPTSEDISFIKRLAGII